MQVRSDFSEAVVVDHPFYQLSVEDTLTALNSRVEELTRKKPIRLNLAWEVMRFRNRKTNFVKQYIQPVFNLMLVILFIAGILQFLVGNAANGTEVLLILALNITIALAQQYRAEKTLEALEHITAFKALVIRDGQQQKIEADQLIPGDILLLKTGRFDFC